MKPNELPDFDARWKSDSDAFEKNAVVRIGRWERSLAEAETLGDFAKISACKTSLESMRRQVAHDREQLKKNHETWKASLIAQKNDYEFLCGYGPLFDIVKAKFDAQKELYGDKLPPETFDPVVGYVEIHQWWNEGKDKVIEGFTTFQDVADMKDSVRITINWWRKKPGIKVTKANKGFYLYAINLGGSLKLVDFNPDSSD